MNQTPVEGLQRRSPSSRPRRSLRGRGHRSARPTRSALYCSGRTRRRIAGCTRRRSRDSTRRCPSSGRRRNRSCRNRSIRGTPRYPRRSDPAHGSDRPAPGRLRPPRKLRRSRISRLAHRREMPEPRIREQGRPFPPCSRGARPSTGTKISGRSNGARSYFTRGSVSESRNFTSATFASSGASSREAIRFRRHGMVGVRHRVVRNTGSGSPSAKVPTSVKGGSDLKRVDGPRGRPRWCTRSRTPARRGRPYAGPGSPRWQSGNPRRACRSPPPGAGSGSCRCGSTGR